jgi:hypothetical protein
VLIDLDPSGGGLDVPLGIETIEGARWSGLRVAGGHLDPQVLLAGLPLWGSVSVLAGDRAELPAPEALSQVLAAARELGPVVLDLARRPCATRATALRECALVTVLVTDDVAGVTAARAVLAGLGEVPVGVLVRGGPRRAGAVADLVGARLLGRLPPLRRRSDLPAGLRGQAGVAAGVLDAVCA